MEGSKLLSSIKDAISLKERFSPENLSEMGWLALGQFFNILLSFVIIKLISSMGTEGYGIYALVITITQLTGFLMYGPAVQTFLRFYYYFYDKGSSRSYTGVMYRFLFAAAAIIILAGILTAILNEVITLPITLLLIALCTAYAIGFKTDEFFSASLNMIRKRKQNSIFQITEKMTNIILFWLLKKYFVVDVYHVLIVFIITSVSFSLMKVFIFNRLAVNRVESPLPNSHARTEVRKALVPYAVPFVIWGISGWFQLNSEKWIIANYLSTSDVGIYSLMINLVNAFIVIPSNILIDFGTPIIFQSFSDFNNKEKVKTGYLYIRLIVFAIAILAVIASVISYYFGRQIIHIISSENFTAFWYLLPLFCIGTGLFYIAQAMSYIALALNVPQRYVIPKTITGALAIALNIIFVIYFGINGIAYSSIAINVFYLFIIWWINKRIMGGLSKA